MPCLIAAPASGSGKTLVSLALSALARQRGCSIQTFKVGPDYLDPQLLSAASGRPCRNLDPLLCGSAWVQQSFEQHSSQAELCLVEGVMGLFDGRGPTSEGSSAHVAQLLHLPVVLVVEASRQAGSVAALVRGFRDHQPQLQLAGVVLNGIGSARHRTLLEEALASIAMPVLGALPRDPRCDLPSRHLGLLPAHELADLQERLGAWAALAEQHLRMETLWPLLQSPTGRSGVEQGQGNALGASPNGEATIAIATDAAFHFRYPEASELLEAQGLEVAPWSPLADQALPKGCRAVVLPGGYPELHAADLAASTRSLQALRQAHSKGMPIYAECGGLLLLGETLLDSHGEPHSMAGILPFQAKRGDLSLGYREATAGTASLVLRPGETFCGHEFHRWQLQTSQPCPQQLWQLKGWGVPERHEGWGSAGLHASWLHLHWGGCPSIPRRLAAAAKRWGDASDPCAAL